MDKRYQIFVSSTFKDLEEERKHIIQTLMEMDCIPAGMELFPAVDEEQWDFIKKVIDDCDYYLLLIGGRYGSLSPEGIGYTEMEYDYAVAKGMKVIALVHGEPDNLAQIKCEKDPTLQAKLEKFRAKVCTGRLVKFWKNLDQISGIVSLSLTKTIRTYPAVGWVRADLVADESSAKEILKLRDKIKELENAIENLKVKPEGLDNLSQGEDIVGLDIHYKANKKDDPSSATKKSYQISVELTWNNIFEYLSTSLIVENSEENLLILLAECIERYCYEQIATYIQENHLKNIINSRAYKEDLRLVIVQFRALKLIELSTKRHPPSDNNVYWTLTPYGDQLMTELTALKRTF
ncbi:DUF4062 domain-containing protein [Acinetobacter baumannii]|uniref:DUF4062 domain-containing protein n=1 Tax=Acinetobacter baumannii TaxID=470 RepID=UPI0005143AE9|nr:DUF4062 domain-containing protein [Acinetobacter baumannii]KGF60051.1 hypothetical protein LH92_09190 [Acinetobacter baumannii]MDC5626244.1 DUF4062 domain-containing protein [Acinetobacter baumannii]HCU0566072.1 DUF4062 domain-containing protein [Acinetobacter baumannii]